MSLKNLINKANERKAKDKAKNHPKPEKKADESVDSCMFDYKYNYFNIEDFQRNKRKAQRKFGEEFGDLGTVIEYGRDHEINAPVVPEDFDENNFIQKTHYSAEYTTYQKRLAHYRESKPKGYHWLWNHCTIAMQNAVKQDPEFAEFDEEKDPVRLWLRIVDVSLNGTGAEEDDSERILAARRKFENVRQKPNETVGAFYDRFNIHYDAMLAKGSALCQLFIPPELPEDVRANLLEDARVREELMKAGAFLNKLDPDRFKTMRDELNNAKQRGRDEYPKTLNDAYVMASRYKERGVFADGMFAKKDNDNHGSAFVAHGKGQKRSGEKGDKGQGDDAPQGRLCWLCGDPDHVRGPNCSTLRKAAEYFSKHPLEEFMNQVKGLTKKGNIAITYHGLDDFILLGADALPFNKNDVLLDNQASVSVFCNADLLTNLRKADVPLTVRGVGKGSLHATQVGDFLDYGPVYFHPGSIANIWCFADVHRRYGIQFRRNAFSVKTGAGILVFHLHHNHYICNVQQIVKEHNVGGVLLLSADAEAMGDGGRGRLGEIMNVSMSNVTTPIIKPDEMLIPAIKLGDRQDPSQITHTSAVKLPVMDSERPRVARGNQVSRNAISRSTSIISPNDMSFSVIKLGDHRDPSQNAHTSAVKLSDTNLEHPRASGGNQVFGMGDIKGTPKSTIEEMPFSAIKVPDRQDPFQITHTSAVKLPVADLDRSRLSSEKQVSGTVIFSGTPKCTVEVMPISEDKVGDRQDAFQDAPTSVLKLPIKDLDRSRLASKKELSGTAISGCTEYSTLNSSNNIQAANQTAPVALLESCDHAETCLSDDRLEQNSSKEKGDLSKTITGSDVTLKNGFVISQSAAREIIEDSHDDVQSTQFEKIQVVSGGIHDDSDGNQPLPSDLSLSHIHEYMKTMDEPIQAEDLPVISGVTVAGTALVETVEGNMLKFTKKQVEAAEVAKRLYSVLGKPSLKDYIDLIRYNRLRNCPVTTDDISRAIAIWGRDLGAVQGKTTRKKPNPIPVEVPVRTQPETTSLYMDIFFISELPFLLSSSEGFGLLTITYLGNRKSETVLRGIKEHVAGYAKYNVKVTTILCDGEGAVAALKTEIELMGVAVEQCSKNEHVAIIERAIRQVKERVRAFKNTLPFQLTIKMLVYLLYYVVKMINAFPRSTSAIEGVSPYKKLTGRDLDYNVDCKLEWGDYVQANEENTRTNSMDARTFPAICLGPVRNLQGSYYFLSLISFEVVKRRSWVKMVLPNDMIARINARAARDNALLANGRIRFTFDGRELDGEDDEEPLETEPTEVDPVAQGDEVIEPHYFHEEDADYFHEEDEVDYEPHYFHEEDDGEEEYHEDAQPAHGYNLRDTPARRRYNEQFALATYNVTKSISEWGQEAVESMKKEMTQLHDKGVFSPVDYKALAPRQKIRVLRSMMLVKRKRNGLLKSRFLADGSMQLRTLAAINPSSPTVSIEALFITAVIDAMQKRHYATVDIEGAYLHCKMLGEVYLKIEKIIADILCAVDSKYERFRLPDGGLVVKLVRALYGCIESARLFYDNISKTLMDFGFVKNHYDQCVFNKTMYDQQCTIVIHVDDLKISCADPRGVEDVIAELKRVYGNINVYQDAVIDYLGMDFDSSKDGVVKISMTTMVDQVIEELKIDKSAKTPATVDLFSVDAKSPKLDKARAEKFHSLVAKLLYMAKRARPDILTAVSFLTTRVSDPTEQDWFKLLRIAKYLFGTRELALHLSADSVVITSYIDASFAPHPDGKSHTGQVINLGGGAVYCRSSKQKLVTKSSTESELVALSDGLPMVLWAKNFLEAQGFDTGPAVIHQDNKSTITLAEKGRSTTNRTRHMNIRYFFVKDRIDTGDVAVKYCGTADMTADFFSKPLQGALFEKHRKDIMNLP